MLKPTYGLEYSVYGCRFSLRVNDVEVVIQQKEEGYQSRIPINPWISPGLNTITLAIQATPGSVLDGDTSGYLRVFGCEFDAFAGKDQAYLGEFTLPEFSVGQGQRTGGGRLEFIVPAFPVTPAYENGLVVDLTNKQTYRGFVDLTAQVYEHLRSQNLPALLALTERRNREYAALLYRSYEEQVQVMTGDLTATWREADLTFGPYEPHLFRPRLNAGGRLVHLYEEGGNDPFFYYRRSPVFVRYFPFYFYLDRETRRWEIIR